jgi:hypothetical protein
VTKTFKSHTTLLHPNISHHENVSKHTTLVIRIHLHQKMFVAKTQYSSKFKALFELLFHNMTTSCFKIDKDGMHLEYLTTQNIFIKLDLPAASFDEYIFDDPEPVFIGIGHYANKFLKTVKNKTQITFSITQPYVFDIEIGSTDPSSNDCVISFSANIESVQNIASTPMQTYTEKGVEISTSNMSKLCRMFQSNLFFVTKKCGQLKFGCDVEPIFKKCFLFGKKDLGDTSMFHQDYRVDQLKRINKIPSFSSENIVAYAEEGKPLMFDCKSEIGSLKVYMFSPEL